MAEKQSSRDRLKEITASIEDGIKELFQSETYAQYLQTMSRFHHYSVNNQVLIHMQKPDATLVAGFNKWKNQFGRNVIKGEHGIKIIAPTPFKKKIEQEKLDPDTQLPMLDADGKIITEEKTIQIPMYKPVTVFDVSQTEGKPLPQLAHDLSGNVANYDVFMEALRRSSPVPISIEVMGGGMDGYFDLEHQDIAIRKGMSEVQTVSAVIHEMAHALLHNRTKDTEEKTPELSRSTEEVQAESISYAVCAYYGIATGDNSFGYIASWSKDKTLPELRESLEVISKTADGLINDIDRHYAEILKEREAELIAAEPAMAMERLYAVDDRYLHVQRTDTGVDYTIYDKASMKELDGGQLDMEISTLAESALEICNSHGIGQNAPLQVADIGILDELQAAQDAVIAIEPPVQENPEPETDTPADPAISVEARNAYGYTDDAMLPLTKERAMELFERDVPVYLLYGDNTEAMAFEQTEILNHDGIFGIDRADWEAVKEQFPVATENRWQKAFQQNPADSYCIYQLRRDPELAELRFMNSQYLREHGLEPAFDHYEAVYSGSLPSDGSTEARLDDLYMKFNTAHPQDFTGHSLSVSDIVVLKQQGAVSSHYVDSVGFVQFPAFLPDNYLKNAEMSMEDDYGMIDGIINNGPKEQPETKPKAPDLSALFEAARQVVQEDKQVSEPGKKPSVLAMLHAPAPSRSEKTAQTKSAERDLI
ncbi:MAG: YodL domain-containing protein [Faecousia sp.]